MPGIRDMRILNTIHGGNLRGDLFGGVTAAIIALPMALAFGVASGAGPAAGLYGALLVGLFAALFGGTPTLISEPTGPMTVVMTAVIANLVAANPEDGMAMAFTVVMMAGGFQILFGALRLGKYVTLMPHTVISGFMSGIGVILIILQLGPVLGHESPKGGVLGTLQALPSLVGDVQPAEVALAALTIAVIIGTRGRLRRIAPPQLVALVVGTLVSVWLLGDMGIRRIGEVPAGLPDLQMPAFSLDQWRLMVVDALVLAMLGSIDALLTSVIADSLTRTEHNSNKELMGQGLGNLASGLFGGMPGAGATMGTVLNIQTGGRTALSGLTRAMILLAVILGAAELTETIPMAVLAGIALKVGIDIIDWGFLRRVHLVSLKGAMITYGVILLTVFVDLIVAVGLGIFVANILTIDRLSKLQARDVKAITDADEDTTLGEEERQLLQQGQGRILLFRLSGPMIFSVAKAIHRQQATVADFDALILDLTDVPVLGVSSSLAIESAVSDAVAKGRAVYIAGANEEARRRLDRLGITAMVLPGHIVESRRQALGMASAALSGQPALASGQPA